jgi:hypothetical protein
MKFLVVSSDVIYPDGAMRDYEPNFYLPFKGFTKPIYAIPGNHDWYDALEGFAANFLEADAARVCMMNRLETDFRLTTRAERRIDGYIREAARLRKEFGVSTGWQRGPIFEVQTERFALIAVDTGVLKTVDSLQWQWLKAALARSRGKFTMALLGHPLYTAGHYQGDADGLTGEWSPPLASAMGQSEVEPFTGIHRLLREHQVEVVMAGDMHYFEHYEEDYPAAGTTKTMHHFVNGGGGAYICVGIPFDWPPHAGAAALDLLSPQGRRHRQARRPDPALEDAGLALGQALQRLALQRLHHVGRLRSQQGAVLPKFRGSAGPQLEG